MAVAQVNGVDIYYELHGVGSHWFWCTGPGRTRRNGILSYRSLADTFQVLVYDRLGHTQSERLEARGASMRTATISPVFLSPWRSLRHTW